MVLKLHNYTSFSERGTDLGEGRLDTKASSFKTTNDDYSCNIYTGVCVWLYEGTGLRDGAGVREKPASKVGVAAAAA